MKVLNLQCSGLHVFEGWFASEEDYQAQKARSLVQCPLCGDAAVHKMPTAPRLNLRAGKSLADKDAFAAEKAKNPASGQRPAGSSEEAALTSDSPFGASLSPGASQAAAANGSGNGLFSNEAAAAQKTQPGELALRALREMVRKSEDVVDRFADEARRMHYEGGKSVRSIRGQTSRSEAIALLEEGIDILPLPSIAGLTETLQ